MMMYLCGRNDDDDDVLMTNKVYRLTQNNRFNLHPTGDP